MEYKQGRFLETTQVKAYDTKSLVGNIGGYVGMILGYALLNIPGILTEIFQNILIKKSKKDSSSIETVTNKHQYR